jgi:hypothetical protein
MRNLRNLTITVKEAVVRWTGVWPDRQHKSVSRLVWDMLKERLTDAGLYEEARRKYLSRAPRLLKKAGAYPTREELHDRVRLC